MAANPKNRSAISPVAHPGTVLEYSLQNCSLGQSAARAPTPATPHHPQFPHKMRLRLPLERICAQYGFGFFG